MECFARTSTNLFVIFAFKSAGEHVVELVFELMITIKSIIVDNDSDRSASFIDGFNDLFQIIEEIIQIIL